MATILNGLGVRRSRRKIFDSSIIVHLYCNGEGFWGLEV
ncbi:hypothetical protein MC7420_2271 [Coleofasciculus chthonoplastes PCC 7420]|uniref:Uncharacterized protein n=1 Tax=Coleofasciculus chthonoplastes PCC 7420 TaxID=118168 RepID=B4VSC3_9CYAN|nr:hypothetical protein MC7420_2271 [Coleofasciculus chthonoplastes PCC 7420]